ncbi:MAG TPA: bifunctional nuclease family protein [Ignavibacteria bacterium]|nr:bifunctional nuclease family protein [Ignavibacteria bacterium]
MDNNDIIQVDIYGLSLSSSLQGGGYAIILKEVSGDRRIPIIIGHSEAQAIAFELEGIKPPRPLTHDLTKNIIEALGFNVTSVIINELKDSTFYAKIKFDASSLDEMDARPSDAIALALKFSAPIFISSSIMDEIGFVPENENQEIGKIENVSEYAESSSEETINESPKERKLRKLKGELDEAIAKEDYEKAATLRDEIRKIDLSNLN